MLHHRLAAMAVCTSLLFIGGCGKIKKTKECNEFIEMVNSSLQNIEKQTQTKSDDPKKLAADMKNLASLYDKLSTDVGGLDLSTEELKAHAKEYQTMAKGAADAAREVAEALEKQDPSKATSAQNKFTKITAQETTLVNKINTFCSAP